MQASQTKVLDRAYGAVEQLEALIHRRGELQLLEGKLHAGGAPLAGANDLVEQVKVERGFGCTIFEGNRRIAATARSRRGERAVGTHASERITQQVFRRGERFNGLAHILGRNWVVVYTPLRDHMGMIVGMLAAYRELEDFLGHLSSLDGTTEAVILHDHEGRLIDANRTTCDMLALSRTTLLAQSMHDFTATSAQALRAAWADISAGSEVRLESFWRRSDVFAFPVELSVTRAELPGRRLLVTIARDFTEQHRARERLRELNTQLVQAEKMAALGRLVAGVTHDINTPLGAVRSGQQTLTRATAKLRQALAGRPAVLEVAAVAHALGVIEQTLDTVAAGAERIDAVVRRLRSFARLDQATLQEVDLRTCVEDVLQLARHRVPDSVTVTCELGDLPRVRCHPAEVNELLMILLINAIDAVGDAGTIAVRAHASGEAVELIVEDDGEGIAAPDLPNIFNPGFTTKGLGLGGGLGLAIAYQVAQHHRGSISVSSRQGAGTCFTTKLPLVGPTAEPAAIKHSEV